MMWVRMCVCVMGRHVHAFRNVEGLACTHSNLHVVEQEVFTQEPESAHVQHQMHYSGYIIMFLFDLY